MTYMIYILSFASILLKPPEKLWIGIKPLSPLTKDIIAPICLNLSIVSRNNGFILFFREPREVSFVIVMTLKEKKERFAVYLYSILSEYEPN